MRKCVDEMDMGELVDGVPPPLYVVWTWSSWDETADGWRLVRGGFAGGNGVQRVAQVMLGRFGTFIYKVCEEVIDAASVEDFPMVGKNHGFRGGGGFREIDQDVVCVQKDRGAQIVILRVTLGGGDCQIRIDLNDKKIEVRVTLGDPVNFRGVGVGDRAIVPIKDQHRRCFSGRIERMRAFGPARVSRRGALASFRATNGNRDKKTKRESFWLAFDLFSLFYAELKP